VTAAESSKPLITSTASIAGSQSEPTRGSSQTQTSCRSSEDVVEFAMTIVHRAACRRLCLTFMGICGEAIATAVTAGARTLPKIHRRYGRPHSPKQQVSSCLNLNSTQPRAINGRTSSLKDAELRILHIDIALHPGLSGSLGLGSCRDIACHQGQKLSRDFLDILPSRL
jgi:hypothetical protein